ncbi:MAG: LytTR family DNA-binding domain-containing protein [Muribaculaceae bacterium]|nr:LytTR family DNA-binding domain-containing protein [Muribaculaceae bacterium]
MNRKIKCVAIDDEPLALDVISKFCERIGNVEIKVFSDPGEGLETINRDRPDIVFLDIEMENKTGLEIAAQLPESSCFIFTTAYLNYAMDGFELDAVDYLHKPFAFSRFETAFRKALRRLGLIEKNDDRYIVVKQEYNNVSIFLREILYVEAMEGYVKIFREDGICTVSRITLKNIGSLLPETDFLRIHRSYTINKTKVRSFNKREVELKNGHVLPVGRQYSPEVSASLSSTCM